MNQIGLVLAGGGGKGAYQIGVWRYLKEKGLDQYVGGVSGTSVGALNAVLFAAGDIFAAEKNMEKYYTEPDFVQQISGESGNCLDGMEAC